ncbi:MAG TPA: Fic family protein [Ramlibacter sp.]|nr:Fic family protein [Ramlibacter sp.]
MPTAHLDDSVVEFLAELRANNGVDKASPSQIAARLNVPESTLRRSLGRLVQAARILREGAGPGTRYSLPTPIVSAHQPLAQEARTVIPWTERAKQARERLREPLGARQPVTYERGLVDSYAANKTSLLPASLATELYQLGKTQDQQPAGTYARNVLEQLLIDLSWSSSRLEGNQLSRLDTEELFKSGATGGDRDAVMLLNHKQAIEFMVETVPQRGLKLEVVTNIHAVLMQDLLHDDAALGAIRRKMVRISDTVYVPTQMPQLLQEMLELILQKAAQVNNPLEAAFFLWVNLAYLQPFEDGNKRVSRLAANIPLMIFNCAPLSFLDVDLSDYADAMLAVYEFQDMAPATDLFAWTYRRSCMKYAAVARSIGAPDPVRVKFRPLLTEAIGRIVREKTSLRQVLTDMGLDSTREPQFEPLLRKELEQLQHYNCARYRLTTAATQAWIDVGRPV